MIATQAGTGRAGYRHDDSNERAGGDADRLGNAVQHDSGQHDSGQHDSGRRNRNQRNRHRECDGIGHARHGRGAGHRCRRAATGRLEQGQRPGPGDTVHDDGQPHHDRHQHRGDYRVPDGEHGDDANNPAPNAATTSNAHASTPADGSTTGTPPTVVTATTTTTPAANTRWHRSWHDQPSRQHRCKALRRMQ